MTSALDARKCTTVYNAVERLVQRVNAGLSALLRKPDNAIVEAYTMNLRQELVPLGALLEITFLGSISITLRISTVKGRVLAIGDASP